MDKIKFIFIVETGQHLNMLSRLSQLFSRGRICIDEWQANTINDTQRFTISIKETKESAARICRKIEGQVDVISVNLFEHTNQQS